jgi:hypothetical protein
MNNIALCSVFGYTFTLKDYILAGSVLLNIILLIIFYLKFYYNTTAFVKLIIRKHKKDFPEFKIKVRNTGVIPFELDPPVVVFKKKGAKRLFQVRTGTTIFPLSLFKKEEYDFFVDLARFYNTDSSLITYRRVYLEIRDKNQIKLARKRIRIK